MQLSPYSITSLIIPPKHGVPAERTTLIDTTTVSSASITPGQIETVNSTFTDRNGPLKNGILDLEIYNSSGHMVGQKFENGVPLAPGQSNSIAWKWTAPNSPGMYTLKAFAFSGDMANTYLADQNSGNLAIDAGPSPTFSTQTTVTPVQATQGQTVTIQAIFTDTSLTGYLSNGSLIMQVFDTSGKVVGTQYFTDESFSAGQSRRVPFTWTAPSTPGTYTSIGGG